MPNRRLCFMMGGIFMLWMQYSPASTADVNDGSPAIKQVGYYQQSVYAPIQSQYFEPQPQPIVVQSPIVLYGPQFLSPPSTSENDDSWLLLAFALMALMNRNTATTTPSITTANPGSCTWTYTTLCSLPCRGMRTRTRTCGGLLESEEVLCNTETGFFLPDGLWYRASNCYDYHYILDGDLTYDDAKTACTNLNSNAEIASKGLRDDAVRNDVLQTFYNYVGPQTTGPWVGVTDATTGTYVWEDGVTATPTFFSSSEPDSATDSCHAMEETNQPFSLVDVSCTTTKNVLCERPAA